MSHPVVVLRRSLMLAWLLVGAFATTAGAHASLVGSDPVDGSSLERAPDTVTLRFDEDVSSRFRRVALLDGRGAVVGGTHLGSGGDMREVVLRAPRLRPGTYAVSWDVLALDDGHVTGGQIVFGVGRAAVAASPAVASRDTSPQALDVGLRWLDFVLLAVAVGGLGVAALIGRARWRGALPVAAADAARRRVLLAAAWGAGFAAVLGLSLLAREAHGLLATLPDGTTDVDALGRLLAERYGVLWVVREVLLVAIAASAVALLAAARSRRVEMLWPAAVGALCVCRALGSHAAAVDRSAPAVAAQALHVAAAATWIGGVLALIVVLWPGAASTPGFAVRLARACGRSVGIAAAGSVVVLLLTGLYAARTQVTSVDGLLTTVYGETLLAKTGVVMLVAALGLGNALLLRRTARRGRAESRGRTLRIGAPRLLLAEGLVGLLALLVAAVLTVSPPPRGPSFAGPRPVDAPTLVREVGDLLVTATARPNRPGTNVLSVVAVSSRRPAPAPIQRMTLRVTDADGSGPTETALRRTADGRYSGGLRLSHEGAWRMEVTAVRSGVPIRALFGWSVQPPDPARAVVYSARPLAPLIDRAALVLLLLALSAAVVAAVVVVPRRLPGREPFSIRPTATREPS